jgi:hypothetical protein
MSNNLEQSSQAFNEVTTEQMIVGDRFVFDSSRSTYGFEVQNVNQLTSGEPVISGVLARLMSEDGHDEVFGFSFDQPENQVEPKLTQFALFGGLATGKRALFYSLQTKPDAPLRKVETTAVNDHGILRIPAIKIG